MAPGTKLIATALGVAGAIALVPIAMALTTGPRSAPPPPLPSRTIELPSRSPSTPPASHQVSSGISLSPELRRRVDAALRSHPAMKPLLAKATYTVMRQGPWTRMRTQERIGLVLEARLSEPVDTPMQRWPSVHWDEAADTYDIQPIEARYTGVSKVLVHLDTAYAVVAVDPLDHQSMTLGPSSQWMTRYTAPPTGDR